MLKESDPRQQCFSKSSGQIVIWNFYFFSFVQFYFVWPQEVREIYSFLWGLCKGFTLWHMMPKLRYMCSWYCNLCIPASRSQNLLPAHCFDHATSRRCSNHVSVPIGTLRSLVHFTAACLVLICLCISHLVIGDSWQSLIHSQLGYACRALLCGFLFASFVEDCRTIPQPTLPLVHTHGLKRFCNCVHAF